MRSNPSFTVDSAPSSARINATMSRRPSRCSQRLPPMPRPAGSVAIFAGAVASLASSVAEGWCGRRRRASNRPGSPQCRGTKCDGNRGGMRTPLSPCACGSSGTAVPGRSLLRPPLRAAAAKAVATTAVEAAVAAAEAAAEAARALISAAATAVAAAPSALASSSAKVLDVREEQPSSPSPSPSSLRLSLFKRWATALPGHGCRAGVGPAAAARLRSDAHRPGRRQHADRRCHSARQATPANRR